MSLEKLLNELLKTGKLKKQNTDINYLNELLAAAERNFEAARLVANKVDEAACRFRPMTYAVLLCVLCVSAVNKNTQWC